MFTIRAPECSAASKQMPPWSALTGDRRRMHDSTPKSPQGPLPEPPPSVGLSCVDSPNLCGYCSHLHDLRLRSAPRSTYWCRVRALVTLLSGGSSPPPLWKQHLEVPGLLPVLLLAFSSHWKPCEDGTTSSVSLMAPRKLLLWGPPATSLRCTRSGLFPVPPSTGLLV